MIFSPFTVGTMRLGDWDAKMSSNQIESFVNDCLELDLYDFDHADIYGGYTTEGDFGKALKNNSSLRTKIQLISKCGINMVTPNRPENLIQSYDSSKAHIIKSVERSLKLLHTDFIDLLLLHRPDYLMDPTDVAEAFEALKTAGKVREFGVSNFSASQFEMLNKFTPLATNQIEVSITALQAFDNGTLDQSIVEGHKPMAWSPLGQGAIFSMEPNERVKRIKVTAQPICEKYDCQLDQLLLSWLLQHPSKMVPVLGTTKLSRIRDAKKALDINLTRQEWYQLFTSSQGHPVP